jgi:hypothetical protein
LSIRTALLVPLLAIGKWVLERFNLWSNVLFRLLDDPKPFVVGIAWVVECAEQRYKVDEAKFQVDLEGLSVAGTVKVNFLAFFFFLR